MGSEKGDNNASLWREIEKDTWKIKNQDLKARRQRIKSNKEEEIHKVMKYKEEKKYFQLILLKDTHYQ